jgi:phenylacetate-coenzyme A ligase PaaK-like adenylate-forming protein
MIESLVSCDPIVLHGKPSYLLDLVDRMRELGVIPSSLRPRLIVVSGETLFEDQRVRIAHAFQALTVNAYACGEGGLVALECEHRKGLHVFSDRSYLEVRAADDVLATSGIGEIVLTNRFNLATPLIRFAMGDLAELHEAKCECGFAGPTLVQLHGREPTVLHGPSRSFFSDELASFMLGVKIEDFQIVASSRFMRISCMNVKRQGTAELCSAFERRFGEKVFFQVVTSRPRLGSKARRFVQLESETYGGQNVSTIQ